MIELATYHETIWIDEQFTTVQQVIERSTIIPIHNKAVYFDIAPDDRLLRPVWPESTVRFHVDSGAPGKISIYRTWYILLVRQVPAEQVQRKTKTRVSWDYGQLQLGVPV